MSAYTQGKPIHEIQVGVAASQELHCVRPDDDVEVAQRLMSLQQLRRLAVVDVEGRPVGVVTMNDLVHATTGRRAAPFPVQSVLQTIAAIGRPRSVASA